jgi:hypothetical protein
VSANPCDLDVRGLLNVDAQLALLELPPVLRRRLLNNVTKRVRSMSRKHQRVQQNVDGSPFAERKGSAKGKKKMEAGWPSCCKSRESAPTKPNWVGKTR